MEVKTLSSYDNYLACNLVITWSNAGTPTTITSEKYCISKDVMVETRFTVYGFSRNQTLTKKSLFIKFSGPHNISVRLQCKFLNINKKYVVDDSEWRLIRETNCPNFKTYNFDLTFEIEPSFEVPMSFAPLYEDTALTDFELRGDDGSVQIHGAALAATSPALRRMLEGNWKETQERAIKIPKTSKATLQHLKDYIYLGVFPENGVENLLLLASVYMMDDLEEKCTTKLIKTLKAHNAIALLKFALKNNLTNLYLSVLEAVERGSIKVSEIKTNIAENKKPERKRGYAFICKSDDMGNEVIIGEVVGETPQRHHAKRTAN